MVQGIFGRRIGPETVPYWQVNSEETRVIPDNLSSIPLETVINSVDSYEFLRIPPDVRPKDVVSSPKDVATSPADGGSNIPPDAGLKETVSSPDEVEASPVDDESLLIGDTYHARKKIFDLTWSLQQSGENWKQEKFIQDNLYIPGPELENLSKTKDKFGEIAKNILELRKTIHQLKVLAIKRNKSPAWVEAQLRWVTQADPFLSMILTPVYQAAVSVPDDPISRLQNLALKKGYRLFFGPFPLDPLLGRPEFLSLRWIKTPGSSDKVSPQWGVLSEDGFFNTGTEALQRMTAALGLFTLPGNTRHGKFLTYGRLLKGLHSALFAEDFPGAQTQLNNILGRDPGSFLPIDPNRFEAWRGMVKQGISPEFSPKILPGKDLPLPANEERNVHQLDCRIPTWDDLAQDLCQRIMFYDRGKMGIYDGPDALGYITVNDTFWSEANWINKELKFLGIKSIPLGISYKVLDQYATSFNRASQIVSKTKLKYPSASLYQAIVDLQTSYKTAKNNGMPILMDRFHRVVQDALLSFWGSVPELFSVKFPETPETPDKLISEEEKTDFISRFTSQLDTLEKEVRALKVAADVLDRDKQETLNQLLQIGLEVLEGHLKSSHPKAAVSAQYTLRLLLSFANPKDLEGFIEPMQAQAKQCAENGQPRETNNWLTSVDLVLHPLGKRLDRRESEATMRLAYTNQRKQLIPSLEQAAIACYDAKLKRERGNYPQGNTDGGKDPDQAGAPAGAVEEFKQIKTILQSWRENAKGLGEDPAVSLEANMKNLKKLQPEAYDILQQAFHSS